MAAITLPCYREPLPGGCVNADDPTLDLLLRARAGDARALDDLFRRYLPRLRRWAHGRMPAAARDLADTEDLIQDTLLRTLRHVETLDPRSGAAFHCYLREALRNRLIDQARRAKSRPTHEEIGGEEVSPGPSPLEATIGIDLAERYERALGSLRTEDREAIVARMEMECSYEEMATHLRKPSADAARMAVSRALVRLAEAIDRAP